jgi:ABC-type multidrug transport system ATPase subunit
LTALLVFLFVAGSHGYLKLLDVVKTKAKAVLIDLAHAPMDLLNQSIKHEDEDEDDDDDDDVPGLFVEREETMEFTFTEMGLQLHGGKIALQGVSGAIKSHTLAAVMGPSGAGKTTFMNALCGRAYYGQVTGEVLINGKKDKILKHRKRVGFVPQDDIVHEDLSVEQNLKYSAELRLPTTLKSGVSRKKWVKKMVEDALTVLQIGHIRDSIVGSVEKRGISGGQRKRVNIGLELVADPVVLFLDEPTSGLDSHSSEVVLGALKEMTTLGMTVVTVIHQPRYSIFSSFDQVLLLGVGGRTVFSGPAANALPYFTTLGFKMDATDNPADFFMDVISGERERYSAPNGHNNEQGASMPTDLTLWPAKVKEVSFKPAELFEEWTVRFQEWTQGHHRSLKDVAHQLSHSPHAKSAGAMGPSTFKAKQINTMLALCDELDRQDGNYDGRIGIATLIEFVDSLARPKGEKGAKKAEESWTNKHIKALERWIKPKLRRGDEEIVISELEEFMRADTTSKKQKPKDLSAAPAKHTTVTGSIGFVSQTIIMIKRSTRKAAASNEALIADLFVLMASAVLMGLLNGNEFDIGSFHSDQMLVVLFFGTLSVVGALKTFGTGQLIFWRESAAGVNPLSFFVAKCLTDIPVLVLKPFLYTWVYAALTMPRAGWWDLPIIMLSLSWACSGWGYVLSILLPPSNSTLCSVIFSIVMGAFLSGIKPEIKGNPIRYISFSYYALEGLCLSVYNYQPDHVTKQAYDNIATTFGWGGCDEAPCVDFIQPEVTASDPFPTPYLDGVDTNAYSKDEAYFKPVLVLFCMGLTLRFIAAMLLIYTKRNRQVKPTVYEMVMGEKKSPVVNAAAGVSAVVRRGSERRMLTNRATMPGSVQPTKSNHPAPNTVSRYADQGSAMARDAEPFSSGQLGSALHGVAPPSQMSNRQGLGMRTMPANALQDGTPAGSAYHGSPQEMNLQRQIQEQEMELQRQIYSYEQQKLSVTASAMSSPAYSQRSYQASQGAPFSAQSLISSVSTNASGAHGARLAMFDGAWSSMNGNAQMHIRGLDVVWGSGSQSRLTIHSNGTITHSTAPGWVAAERVTGYGPNDEICTLTFTKPSNMNVIWVKL